MEKGSSGGMSEVTSHRKSARGARERSSRKNERAIDSDSRVASRKGSGCLIEVGDANRDSKASRLCNGPGVPRVDREASYADIDIGSSILNTCPIENSQISCYWHYVSRPVSGVGPVVSDTTSRPGTGGPPSRGRGKKDRR